MDERSLFEQVGGEPAVRALVDHFYDVMDSDPAAKPIRHLHPDDIATSRTSLYWFLCGWLGGPQLYVERKGHPRLRARHLPFSIGDDERDQWMYCMRMALEAQVQDVALRAHIEGALARLADHMRNVE